MRNKGEHTPPKRFFHFLKEKRAAAKKQSPSSHDDISGFTDDRINEILKTADKYILPRELKKIAALIGIEDISSLYNTLSFLSGKLTETNFEQIKEEIIKDTVTGFKYASDMRAWHQKSQETGNTFIGDKTGWALTEEQRNSLSKAVDPIISTFIHDRLKGGKTAFSAAHAAIKKVYQDENAPSRPSMTSQTHESPPPTYDQAVGTNKTDKQVYNRTTQGTKIGNYSR